MSRRLTDLAFKKILEDHVDDLMYFRITKDDLVDIVRAKGVPESIVRMVVKLDFFAAEDEGDDTHRGYYWSCGLNVFYRGTVFRIIAAQEFETSVRDIESVSYKNEDIDCTISRMLGSRLWRSSYIRSDINDISMDLPKKVHNAVIELMERHSIKLDQRPQVHELQEQQEQQELQVPQTREVTVSEDDNDDDGNGERSLNVGYRDKIFRVVGIPGMPGKPGIIKFVFYQNRDIKCSISYVDSLRVSNYICPDHLMYDWIELTIPENVHQIIIKFMDRYGIERPMPVSKPKGPKQTKTSILRATKTKPKK